MERHRLFACCVLVLSLFVAAVGQAADANGIAAGAGQVFALGQQGESGSGVAGSGERDSYWFVGVEAAVLDVEADTGGQVTLTINDADTAGTDLSVLDADGLDDEAYAPRLFFGWQINKRWGVVARLFNLEDHDDHPPAPAPGATNGPNFATFSVTDNVKLYTADVEGTFTLTPGPWRIDAHLGAREAKLEADSLLSAFGVFTSGNFLQLALSNGSAFRGKGATAAVIGSRQFGKMTRVFLGLRESRLSGQSDSFGRAVGSIVVSPNPPLVGAATVTRNNADQTDLDISEFQAGVVLDFRQPQSSLGAYIRASVELQDWKMDGPPTGGAGVGGTSADLTVSSFSSAGLGGVEMAGLFVATGVTW